MEAAEIVRRWRRGRDGYQMRERLKRGMGEREVGEGEKNRRVDVDCIVEEEAGVEMNCSEEGC